MEIKKIIIIIQTPSFLLNKYLLWVECNKHLQIQPMISISSYFAVAANTIFLDFLARHYALYPKIDLRKIR